MAGSASASRFQSFRGSAGSVAKMKGDYGILHQCPVSPGRGPLGAATRRPQPAAPLPPNPSRHADQCSCWRFDNRNHGNRCLSAYQRRRGNANRCENAAKRHFSLRFPLPALLPGAL